MSKETVVGAVYAAGGATLIIHPHAAIAVNLADDTLYIRGSAGWVAV